MEKLKLLDLFSGLGGFSLGLERAGMETVAFCEIEDYPVSILNKHWPDVPVHRDIRKLDGRQYYNKIDLLCGGFPCQPFSVAGQQKGKEDDRHLWPEMLRIIKESRPTWVIGENVAGFIKMALDDVLLDLETEGYTAQSFVIPACSVGGIHRRDRVWIVAYTNKQGESTSSLNDCKRIGVPGDTKHAGRNGSENGQGNSARDVRNPKRTNEVIKLARSNGKRCDDADTKSKGLQRGSISGNNEAIRAKSNDERLGRCGQIFSGSIGFTPIRVPTEPSVRHRNDGLSQNVARLKALGNAVVPQIPELIGRAIIEVTK